MKRIVASFSIVFLLASPASAALKAEVVASSTTTQECLAKLKPGQTKLAPFDPEKETVIIVDGYSSGRFFAPAFRKEGYQVVHIHSRGAPPKPSFAKTFWPESYELDLRYTGNMTAILGALRNANITAILPGADSGVTFADELTAILARTNRLIPSNGVDLARKDKYLMAERLRAMGLDAVRQFKTSDPQAAIQWAREQKLFTTGARKAVIKPILSGGSDGLFFAHSEAEVVKAFKALVNQPDESGNINHEVLIQEYLEGDEYVINTTSRDGKHVVTDIWKYSKRLTPDGLHIVYDYDELLPFEGYPQKQLTEYNNKVLAALKIFHGNGHSEIKMVPGRGPVLIEMNSRMMGSSQPLLAEIALGHSQVDRSVLAMTKPDEFRRLAPGYEMKNHAFMVTLANFKGKGAILNPDGLAKIRALPGYVHHSMSYKENEPMEPTDDLGSAIGDVWLVHPNRDVLLKSIEELHRMEQDGTLVVPRSFF